MVVRFTINRYCEIKELLGIKIYRFLAHISTYSHWKSRECGEKEKIFIIITVMGVLLALYLVLVQPKLEAEYSFAGYDGKVVILTIGNRGFQDIHIRDVLVNIVDKPETAKIQLQQEQEGFAITETFDDPGYTFADYDAVAIEPGTASKGDVENLPSPYGLTVKDSTAIPSVTIVYEYLGKEFKETVIID